MQKKKSLSAESVDKIDVKSKTKAFQDEPEEHEESTEKLEEEMDLGEVDEDVYTEEGREKLVEDDEINAGEEGYAQGASSTKKHKEHKH